jgi:hypothetical protein
MKTTQRQYIAGQWKETKTDANPHKVQLVLAFGAKNLVRQPERYDEIRNNFPNSSIVLCSTSGEILGSQVFDDTISVTAIEFDSSHIEARQMTVNSTEESQSIGKQIGDQLPKDNLKHVMIFGDGIIINGSELANGLKSALPENVAIIGGSAGDAADFKETYVGLNGVPAQNMIVAIGFYGDNLTVSYGSAGGFDTFGITRQVTKSIGRTVYELDHKPILDIYKEYLGDTAKDLPASGLAFPLNVTIPGSDIPLVRTLMSVNQEEGSATFAGGVPEGSYAQLMRANINHLVDGAENAAKMTASMHPDQKAELAVLISCIGRKLVLKQRTEEEIDVIRNVFGNDCTMTGFYTYGEYTQTEKNHVCTYENQTMTIAALAESNPFQYQNQTMTIATMRED